MTENIVANGLVEAMTDLFDNADDTVWITDTETMFDRLASLYILAGGDVNIIHDLWPEVF